MSAVKVIKDKTNPRKFKSTVNITELICKDFFRFLTYR